MEQAKKGCTTFLANGKFIRQCMCKTEGVYLYEFASSQAANKAKSDDFAIKHVKVSVDDIVAPVDEYIVKIDMFVFSPSAVEEMIKKVVEVKSQIDNLPSLLSDEDTIESRIRPLSSKLMSAVEEVRDVHCQLDIGEVGYSNLIYERITKVAKGKGYIVKSNKSVVSRNVRRYSMYCTSRPDLVIYHPSKLVLGSIVAAEQSEQCRNDECDDEDPTTTLMYTGGITENTNSDVIGQLLGGMEKLAGELAHEYIKSAENPIFHVMELYGLCIYLGEGGKYCTAHKLVMDFRDHRSTLYSSREGDELSVEDGVNRLLAALELKRMD